MATRSHPAGRTAKRLGLLLMVLGVLAGIGSGIFIVAGIGASVVDTITAPVFTAPFQTSLELKHHRYQLLQQTGTQRGGGGLAITNYGSVTLTPADVRVLGPAGDLLASRQASGSDTIDRSGVVFTGAVDFDAPSAGLYQISVNGPPGSQLIIAEDVAASVGSVAGWFAGLGLGGLAFVAGFIVLLVGFSQQRRAAPGEPVLFGQPAYAQAPYAQTPYGQPQYRPPPAGWYPDPQRAGQLRYWDGSRWQQ